jgi:cysteinyl-tRNA synthetase
METEVVMGRSRDGCVRGRRAWKPAACLAVCALAAWASAAQPGEPGLVVLPPQFPQSVVVVREHTESTVPELIDSGAGYKVVEPTVNGRASGDLSPADVAAMKHTEERDCFSVVLAYLPIGQAEDHRGYWRDEWVDGAGVPIPGVAPGWLGSAVSDEAGRYRVRYWHRAWKDLLFGTTRGANKSALDRIIDQGFDGVYLDAIDAYEFWSAAQGEVSRPVARERMVRLAEQVREYARERRGSAGFRVYVQGGESIVLDDAGQPDDLTTRYGAVVDGVGFEDLFFDGTRRVPEAQTLARLEKLGPLYANRAWCAAIGCGPQFFAIDCVLRGDNLNTLANRRRATKVHELAIGAWADPVCRTLRPAAG